MGVLGVFGPVFAMMLVGIGLGLALWLANWLLSPTKPVLDKYVPYECGEKPWGQAQLQINVHYYIIALIFVIFDVEIIFLTPWAVVYKEMAKMVLLPMIIFLIIVFVPFVYALRKGGIEWIR